MITLATDMRETVAYNGEDGLMLDLIAMLFFFWMGETNSIDILFKIFETRGEMC